MAEPTPNRNLEIKYTQVSDDLISRGKWGGGRGQGGHKFPASFKNRARKRLLQDV